MLRRALSAVLRSQPIVVPAGADVWIRWLPYVALYDRLVCVCTVIGVALWGGIGGGEVVVGSLLVAAQLLAREIAWSRGPLWATSTRWRLAYMTVLVVVFAGQRSLSFWYDFSEFMLYLQVLLSLRIRWVVWGSAALGLAASLGELAFWRWSLGPAVPGIAFELLMAAGTVLLGVWLVAISDQSGRRRLLIEELESTRRELAAAERQAGVLEERARLAREIHDTLTQEFVSVVTHLAAADALLDADPVTARRHVRAAGNVARASLAEARTIVWGLRSDVLGQAGLPAAIERVATAAAAAGDFDVELAVAGMPRPLPEETQMTLLRAAQEGLTNVRRHSGARRVMLTLTYFEDEVSLDIVDDGKGFDPAEIAEPGEQGGFGLRGMRERAGRLGGSLSVESRPGGGTAVAISLPAVPAAGVSAPADPGEIP